VWRTPARRRIARAIGAEPDLLVCDEVSSPRVSVQAMIIEMLRPPAGRAIGSRCCSSPTTWRSSAIWPPVVVRSCHKGRIGRERAGREVFEHPRDPYTIRLMSDAPSCRRRRRRAAGRCQSFGRTGPRAMRRAHGSREPLSVSEVTNTAFLLRLPMWRAIPPRRLGGMGVGSPSSPARSP